MSNEKSKAPFFPPGFLSWYLPAVAMFWVLITDRTAPDPSVLQCAFFLLAALFAGLGPAYLLNIVFDSFSDLEKTSIAMVLAMSVLFLDAFPRSGTEPQIRVAAATCKPVGALNIFREKVWPFDFWVEQSIALYPPDNDRMLRCYERSGEMAEAHASY